MRPEQDLAFWTHPGLYWSESTLQNDQLCGLNTAIGWISWIYYFVFPSFLTTFTEATDARQSRQTLQFDAGCEVFVPNRLIPHQVGA